MEGRAVGIHSMAGRWKDEHLEYTRWLANNGPVAHPTQAIGVCIGVRVIILVYGAYVPVEFPEGCGTFLEQ